MYEEKLAERLSVKSQNVCFFLISLLSFFYFATSFNKLSCGWLGFFQSNCTFLKVYHSFYVLLRIIPQWKLLIASHTYCIIDTEKNIYKNSANESYPTEDCATFTKLLKNISYKPMVFSKSCIFCEKLSFHALFCYGPCS